MPRFQAKLSDGRTVLLEADEQPTEDDILGAVSQHETLAKGIEASTRTAGDVLRNIASPAAAMASQMGRAQIEKPKLQRQQREAQVAGDIAGSEATSAGVGEQVAEFARTFPQRAVKAPFELAQAAGIPIGKPTLSPDDIAYLRDQYAKLQSPLIGPQQAGPKEQAITDWLNEQASGMTSPEMVAAVGTPMAAKLAKMSPEAIGEAGRLIARGFQAQMAAGVPEAVQATVEAPDTPSRIKAGLSATAAVGLPLAIEAGLTKPTPKIPDYPGSRIQSPERGVVTALGNEEMQAEAKKQAAMLELGRSVENVVPAIKTMSGEVVAGDKGQSHNDIIEQNKIPAKEVDRREFVDTATGQEVSREKLATAIPTKKEGEAHSSDLAKAQEVTVAEPKVLPPDTKQIPPNSTFIKVVNYDGKTTGVVAFPHDGTPEGIAKANKQAEAFVNQNFKWKDEFYNTTSQRGATDANGVVKWVVSPGGKISEVGTPDAAYTLGDIEAFKKDRAKRAVEARKAGNVEESDKAIMEQVTESERKATEHQGYADKQQQEYADAVAKQKAGVSVKTLDDRFSSWKDYLKHLKGHVEAQLHYAEQYRQEAAKWRGQLTKTAQPPPPTPTPVKAEPSGLPAGVGARKATKEGRARADKARQQMRDAINNPDLVGKQRADTIANLRNLVNFLDANSDTRKPLETDYFKGDQIAYTGVDHPEGREFIYLEGANAGDYGVTPPQVKAEPSGAKEPTLDEINSRLAQIDTELKDINKGFITGKTAEQARGPLKYEQTRLQVQKHILEKQSAPPPAQPKGETPPTPPPVEQKGVEPEKGPGMVGMGGATPQEFEQPGTYVSNMFAAIDRDRAELGKPPMDPTVRRSWGEDNQRALAQMNRDPNWIPNLISEVLKRPRPLLSWENAGLVWQRAFWKTEYNNALKRIAQAFDDNRTEDLTAAKTDAAVFEDKLEELDRAVGRNGTGSEAGRTLQAQKMGAGDDFTLIEMTLQKRAAVGGRRLTAEESANLAKEHARLEALNTELQKELATRDERLAKSEADRAMAELKSKSVPTFDKRILAAAENIVSKMETAADAARERIKARFAQPGAMSGPIDPTLIDDFAVVASAKIARAGLDLAKLTDDMAREFGDMVKEHMPAIWSRANEMLDSITAKVPDPVKRIVRKQGLDEQKQVFIENIKEKATKGEKKSFNWYVQKMARELYKSGITERDDLINALHGLLKQAVPDITLRQTQDAFSGYGDYKPLSKNEITVALRGMKGELQQIAKLEDMEKGKPPLKSGMERRTPTEVERKLIKLVNDAKNKFQVPVSDPETQLKSALDTLKTTLENRIKDYADRLARKDFSPRPRREIVLDSRANQLKVEAERIKKRFREELIADRLKNRNPWEKVMDWGTKLRRFDILSSPVVIPKLISAGIQRLTSLPLEEEVGGVFKRIPGYKQVFEKAPLEGGGRNLSAEMVGFKSAFMKGLKDAYDVLKTGHSELDVLYGKAGESYTGEFELMSKLLAMPGRIHGMIKAPVKRATFERAVERYAKHYLSQGIPVDDVLKTRIALDAYKAANRSIFLNDNRIALAFNAALRTAEQPLKETGHPTAGGKALATLGRITIPIVKVPLNIVAETMQYATGLVSGNVRLANAFRRGIETLTPEQADLIARELKKGSIGAAILMLGYANADAIGGYYQPGTKKKPGQPKWGSINVFGVNVPSFLLHNPLLETLQIGATIRQVADSKLKKRDKTTQGLSEGVLAAAFGVVEQTPFMREMAEIEKLRNPYTRDRFFGEQAKSLVVPAVVSKAAEWMDPLNPNLQRKPRTTTEYIKSGIPGLRQQLPAERKK